MTCHVVGVDLSTHAIDLVKLDENHDRAVWTRIRLEGATAWDRVRQIRTNMPYGAWWDDVYLAAIERPFSQSRKDPIRLVEGAVLATIPAGVHVWEVAPQTWKAHIGYQGRGKPGVDAFPFRPDGWPQDALDALGVALYTRDENARGVTAGLAS